MLKPSQKELLKNMIKRNGYYSIHDFPKNDLKKIVKINSYETVFHDIESFLNSFNHGFKWKPCENQSETA